MTAPGPDPLPDRRIEALLAWPSTTDAEVQAMAAEILRARSELRTIRAALGDGQVDAIIDRHRGSHETGHELTAPGAATGTKASDRLGAVWIKTDSVIGDVWFTHVDGRISPAELATMLDADRPEYRGPYRILSVPEIGRGR